MNIYAYCGNNPLTYVDPSGATTIAFYDGGDPQRFRDVAMGADRRFDLRNASAFNMTCKQYVLWALRALLREGCDMTDVYILDHGWNGEDWDVAEDGTKTLTKQCEGGISLGDEWYTISGPNDYSPGRPGDYSLKDFGEGLKEVTRADDPTTPEYDGTKIHLGGCYGGLFADEMALWTDRRVTGFTGPVRAMQNLCGLNYVGLAKEPGADDDEPGYEYVEYDPGGSPLFTIAAEDYRNWCASQ